MSAGVALPLGETTDEVLTEIRRLLVVVHDYGFDVSKRLARIEAVLDPGARRDFA